MPIDRWIPLLLLSPVLLAGCGTSANSPIATAPGPQTYMSPVVTGSSAGSLTRLTTYAIDDAAKTFSQISYSAQSGMQVNYSGTLSSLSRGLLAVEMTYPQPSKGWALELAGQAGGLVQLEGQLFAPIVPAETCPSSTPQTYEFVTIPAPLVTSSTLQILSWNPQLETAYGSADISASGTAVTLNNIQQFTLPNGGSPGTPATPSPANVTTAVCSSTAFGNAISIPGLPTITNPGNIESVAPQALAGIGPSGFLVENNGNTLENNGLYYQNALGAGTGAIGLPKPSSPVDTGALAGAQYLGVAFGSGLYPAANNPTNGAASTVVSFGFPNVATACPAPPAPQTATVLYGGDFPGNDPALSSDGYGNCNFAIDLGAQDPASNGVFPNATVTIGAGFVHNGIATRYSFPAVAITGTLQGKYAILLIGQDLQGAPHQGWGIYLLQSN